MTQNLRDFTQSVYLMDAVVRRVPGTAWSLSSPCEGWTARDVVGHVSAVLTAAAEMVVTGEMVLPETSADLTDPEVLWTRARTSILSAIDEPGALTREEKQIDHEARLAITRELGHDREQVTAVYLGR